MKNTIGILHWIEYYQSLKLKADTKKIIKLIGLTILKILLESPKQWMARLKISHFIFMEKQEST